MAHKDDKTQAGDPTESDTDTITMNLSSDAEESQPASVELEKLPAEVRAHLDEALIGKARDLRQARQTIRERLVKIEASRSSVKDTVYKKVKDDYGQRLKETKSALLDFKANVDQNLAELRHQEAEVTRKVMEHEDTLEEAMFRKELGEFSSKDYKAVLAKEESALKQARSAQDALKEAIAQYESLFSAEDLEEIAAAKGPPQEAPPAPPPPNVGAAQPRTAGKQGEAQAVPSTPEPKAAQESKQGQVQLYENGQATNQFALDDELTIGRSPGNQIVLKEPRVSRRHAVIRRSGNQYLLVDNNSSNGTYVNGNPVTEQVLSSGDKIQVGSYEMVFSV